MAIDLSAVTLTELRYAIAVADHRHFGRAAAACFVTQPTLSTQVQKLERSLGVKLFERSNRRVDLTGEGEEIVREARAVLAAAERILEVARSKNEPGTGTWRLGVIPTLAPYLLPWLVPRLREAFPKLRLVFREMKTSDVLAEIAARKIDCGMLALPVEGTNLTVEPIFDEPFHVIVPAAHALAGRKSVHESDLLGERVLLLDEGHCLREQALSICARAGAVDGTEAGDFRATSLPTLRRMVGSGMGITLLPALALRETLEGTAALPFAGSPPFRRMAMVWRASHPRARDCAEIAAVLRKNLPEEVRPVSAAARTAGSRNASGDGAARRR
ncbi:MAG: LysR substrate-binding domain-containing protein [Planctomycetota bacterium]